MSSDEKRSLDLKKAFSDLARDAAPSAPDIDRAMAFAPRESRDVEARLQKAVSRRLRIMALPIAAVLAVAIGTALTLVRAIPPASRSAALDPDYLLSSVRSQAALGVGLPANGGEASAEFSGIESDILGYVESLWSLPESDADTPPSI